MPTPTSDSLVAAAREVNNSGAEEPAAINVAPATSSDKSNFSEMASSDGTKKSSQIIATATNSQRVPKIQAAMISVVLSLIPKTIC